MATAVRCSAFLAVLLAIHSFAETARASFDLPFTLPFIGNNTCQENNICGKGNCTASSSSLTGYQCDCDRGWTQTRSKDDQLFKFLPCIIPNCSLNLDCGNSPAPAPAPANQNKTNSSFIDPCFWADCGGGLCNKTSPFTRTCECYEGYQNLFNSSTFPCYKECAIGVGCSDLGITIPREISPPPPPSPSNNAITLGQRVEFGWLIASVSTLVLLILLYI